MLKVTELHNHYFHITFAYCINTHTHTIYGSDALFDSILFILYYYYTMLDSLTNMNALLDIVLMSYYTAILLVSLTSMILMYFLCN